MAFCPLPSQLSHRRYLSYATGEAPSLGASASSQRNFSGLNDSPHRSAFSSVKIMFYSTELDHLVKNIFKDFKDLSFLDWMIALAMNIDDCCDLAGDFPSDWLGALSFWDKAIRDGSLALAALFSLGVLKKR